MERIQASIDRIQQRLQRRAVLAFQDGPASTIHLLLSSSSFAEFSDRLEFLGSMAQSDSDLIVEQDVATEQLERTRADLLSLSDLVRAKKTQRDKDWPMIRRLVEAHYFQNRAKATPGQIRFWLQEEALKSKEVGRHPTSMLLSLAS